MKTAAILLMLLAENEPVVQHYSSMEACQVARLEIVKSFMPELSETDRAILANPSQAFVPLLLKSRVNKKIRRETPRVVCSAV